jgi:hypothetical protein
MATVLNECAKEEVRTVVRFSCAKGNQPVEIHRGLVAVYGAGVTAVQHVRSGVGNLEIVR